MSTPLPPVDMTGAIVGQVFKIDFTQFVKFNPANMAEKAHIGLFNESGDGLQIAMQASGNGQYLPAGAWVPFELQPNDGSLTATVTYTLPNPPVSQLNGVYFAPGETIPTNYTLGNSPIGIGGTVNTVGGTSSAIQNDGNPPATRFIEATPSGDASSTVSLDTSGNLILGDATHPGSITSDNSTFFTDGAGFLTLVKLLATSGILNSNGDIIFQSAGGEIGRVTSGSNGGALNLPGAQRSVNGSTTGTCTCYQLNVGPFKICAFYFSNWRNGAAGNQFISIPVAMTSSIHGINGGCGTFQVIKSGSAQTVQILTTLASGGGGVTGVTSVNNNCIWHVDTGFDSLALAGSDVGTHNGIVLMFGV